MIAVIRPLVEFREDFFFRPRFYFPFPKKIFV